MDFFKSVTARVGDVANKGGDLLLDSESDSDNDERSEEFGDGRVGEREESSDHRSLAGDGSSSRDEDDNSGRFNSDDANSEGESDDNN